MDDNNNPERGTLERLLLAHLQEQRRTRRWGIFFKSLGFFWLFLLIVLIATHEGGDFKYVGPHTALIDLQGEIGVDHGIVADDVIKALDKAFEDKQTKGVVLRINSPGGSPVQAGQINDEIRRLKAKYPNIPVYAVVDDICASGGYYIASATDKIFVDKASIVGSIGVLMDGFGFTGTMKKLGIERRLLTAGKHKGFLDPFSPMKPGDVAHAKQMLDGIHQQFIKMVRLGRGNRLKNDPELFSGLVWDGTESIKLGLADGLGSLNSVARDVIHAKNIVDYTPEEGFAERLARRLGTAAGKAIMPWMEERLRLR